MDPLLGRIETLEQHVQQLTQQSASVARRLRWWRRLACSLMALMVVSLPISLGADDRRHDDRKGDKHRGHFNPKHDKHDDKDDKELRKLRERIRDLERKLKHVTSERDENGLPQLVITGANLRIVNGLGRTGCVDEGGQEIPGCPNGVGNLIVGYNEPREADANIRGGSHNVVVGTLHNFSRFGGVVVGFRNTISGDFASVSGGIGNTASGFAASVSGGGTNSASGGISSVSGGVANSASGNDASVSGGGGNTASGLGASVSGGGNNTASGLGASVSGGRGRLAEGEDDWVAGGLFQDE
jgi:hypothetical protein